MDGSDIKKLLDACIANGVLTLTTRTNYLQSDRIDTLLANDFDGTLTATPGDPQVGDDRVTYSAASVKSQNFAFYSKDVELPAVLTVSTGGDGKLDLRLSATMPSGWTLPSGISGSGEKAAESFGQVDAIVSGNVTIDSKDYTAPGANQAKASITAGPGIVFTAGYDLQAKTISLALSATGHAVGIDTIGQLFGASGTSNLIPPNLDLGITALAGSYDIANKRVMFTCTPHNWADAHADIVVWKDATAGWCIFFGVGIPTELSLADVPLVGKYLGALTGGVKLEQIQVALVNTALTADQAADLAKAINGLGTGYVTPPPEGMAAGAALLAVFNADGEKTRITLKLTGSGTGNGEDESRLGRRLRIAQAPRILDVPTPPDGTKWFALQKSFGPVSIQKVGIRYRDGKLAALMNASIAPGGLTIAMQGLGTETPLDTFEPRFTIDGIVVALKEGTVSFSGGLVGTIDPLNLVGELGLTFGQYQLGAIAGYATDAGDPSFFLYGVLNAPLGGPGFIFVNGLAAGFGLNRTLVIPDIDGVTKFPLVQWAVDPTNGPSSMPSGSIDDLAKQVAGTLASLSKSGVVAPKLGEDWIAIGVKFTSFKLVDCFALATVKFGGDFEVDILGLATVKVPPAPAAPTVAEAQLALKATVQPSTGLIAVVGQLTPNSYIMSRSCKLTGGFALCIWASGPHAGDYVLTLGGYSPQFTPPDHYPKVPRLGLDWRISDALSITGDLYFALTSSAVMVGGGLKAVWRAGPVQAWFAIEADFLMAFTPFHYYLSGSIELGASVRVKLLFVHITVSIHIGVGIAIWGPQFSGKATIDLKLVKFTIAFGAAEQGPPPHVSWEDFVTLLLPSQGGQTASFRAVTGPSARRMLRRQPEEKAAPPATPAVVQITAASGLVTTLSDDDGALNWLVDRQTFQLQIQTVIPLKIPQFSGNAQLAPLELQPSTSEDLGFGVGPVGVTNEGFQSSITITVTTNESSIFRAVKMLGNVPKAMWQYRDVDSHGRPQVGDPVNQTTIANVLVGFELTPYVQSPDHTQKMPLLPLQYTIDEQIQPINWSLPVVETSDKFTASQTVATTIGVSPASINRPALLAAMQRAGLTASQSVDVSTLSTGQSNYLLAQPMLRYLGEAA